MSDEDCRRLAIEVLALLPRDTASAEKVLAYARELRAAYDRLGEKSSTVVRFTR